MKKGKWVSVKESPLPLDTYVVIESDEEPWLNHQQYKEKYHQAKLNLRIKENLNIKNKISE